MENENFINEEHQYLTFKLGNEDFAIEISNVREVINYCPITRVPGLPEYLCGVINLRGNIISVTDIRFKLDMNKNQITPDTCIIIIEFNFDENMQTGILTDSVREVVQILPENIDSPPKVGAKINTEFIQGVGRINDDYILILDLEKIIFKDELEDKSEY